MLATILFPTVSRLFSMRTTNPQRPRTKAPEERREDLMNSAQRLFLEHGVAATTIEQITTGADVAKGTFYLHFDSKEDLLGALGERFGQQLVARLDEALGPVPSDHHRERLASWGATFVHGYLDSIRLHDVVFYETRPPAREGFVENAVIDHLSAVLDAGVQAHAWTLDDPQQTAVFLFTGIHGVVDYVYSREKALDRAQLIEHVEHLCLRSVGLA